MQDAHAMQAEGVRLMDAGDWRNGSEKGWLGVRNATEALVWAVTGVHHLTCIDIQTRLGTLAVEQGGEYVTLHNLWAHFIHHCSIAPFTTASTMTTCTALCATSPTTSAAPRNWRGSRVWRIRRNSIAGGWNGAEKP